MDDDEATRTMLNALAAIESVQERVLAFGKQQYATGEVVGIRVPGPHYGKTGKVVGFFFPALYTIEFPDGTRVQFPGDDLRKLSGEETR